MSRQFNIFSLSIFVKRCLISILTSSLMLSSWLMTPGDTWAAPSSADRHNSPSIINVMALGAAIPTLDATRLNPSSASDVYHYSNRPSSDGIGKFYMGREIAQVMGHRGAAWLERPSRIQEEKPHVLMANLDINPTDVIADIGAGTGYLTMRLAPKVPQGKVLAVDVQPEMLAMLRDRIAQKPPTEKTPAENVSESRLEDNVELILASETDPHLPTEAVDMAIMLDVYHELEYPYEVMQQVVRSLRPSGKMILVEYRGENPLVPIKRLHKMTEKQVRKEMKTVGLTWIETNEELPRQHLMIFEKA